MVHEAAKGIVILVIMERLYLTSNASWLEARAHGCVFSCPCVGVLSLTALVAQAHIDYLSIQSLLLRRHGLGLMGQVRTIWHHQKRLTDD